MLYSETSADGFGKVRGETRVSVGYNSFGESEPGDEMSEVFEGYSGTIDVFLTRDEFCCFRASLVNDGEDAVKPL